MSTFLIWTLILIGILIIFRAFQAVVDVCVWLLKALFKPFEWLFSDEFLKFFSGKGRAATERIEQEWINWLQLLDMNDLITRSETEQSRAMLSHKVTFLARYVENHDHKGLIAAFDLVELEFDDLPADLQQVLYFAFKERNDPRWEAVESYLG
jgi:hypothetical protein